MRRVTLSFPWPLTPAETRDLLSFAFQVSLVTYLVYYLIENLQTGFISITFNMNTLLWWVIALGVGATLWPVLTQEKHKTPRWSLAVGLQMGGLAILSALVIGLKTYHAVGKLSILLGICTGLIVIGISYLLYFDQDDEKLPAEKE